ncbi:MAG: hypothetical protein MZU79_03260 [Anaerotruncus sp.]|nr:hypothetical protein [Anaerotruncus sp.]
MLSPIISMSLRIFSSSSPLPLMRNSVQYLNSICVVSFFSSNLCSTACCFTGCPAISVPSGERDDAFREEYVTLTASINHSCLFKDRKEVQGLFKGNFAPFKAALKISMTSDPPLYASVRFAAGKL